MVLGVITFAFFLTRMLPGDPVLFRLPLTHTEEDYVEMSKSLGLDKPIFVQYLIYMRDLLLGDWGFSYTVVNNGAVWDIINQRLIRTLEVMIISGLIAFVVGTKLGIIASKHRNEKKDILIRIFSYLFMSLPSFLIASFLISTVFSLGIKLFPYNGYKSKWITNPPLITGSRIIDCILTFNFYMLGDYIWHLILPIGSMIFYQMVIITRQTRSSLIQISQEDYIRTAHAKGLDSKTVTHKHALRNSLPPTLTVTGMAFPTIFAGNIAIEEAFNLVGIGQLFLHALIFSDYPLMIASVYVCSLVVIVFNLIIDILYVVVDPRISYR